MKQIIHFLFIFPFIISCKEPDFDFVNIKGTRILISLPKDFKQAENIIGLTKGNSSLIQAYDISESYFLYANTNFSKQTFEARAPKVISYDEIKINGYPAKFIQLQIDETQKGYCVAFGDSTFCASLMGAYNSSDDVTGEQIKKAFLNAKYDKNIKVPKVIPGLVFKLSDKQSVLKLAKQESNVVIYSLNGISKISYNPEPYVVASQIAYDGKSSVEYITNLVLENIRRYGLAQETIARQEKGIVNGYESYETELLGKIQGQDFGYYILVLINNGKAVTIEGYCFSQMDKNFKEFKKLANTIEFFKLNCQATKISLTNARLKL